MPPWFVARPDLERRLDGAAGYRLTVVVAGAGYGKSTQLAARAHENGWAWYTAGREDTSAGAFSEGLLAALRRRAVAIPELALVEGAGGDDDAIGDGLAAAVSHALEETLDNDLVLVVDDVHELEGAPVAISAIESLVRYAPSKLHLVLASRHALPFAITRMRGRGEVLDITSTELAFTPEETAERLAAARAIDHEVVESVYAATTGWPAAVHLVAEMLAARRDADPAHVLAALAARGGAVYDYLAHEVLGRETPDALALIRTVAQLERVTPALCAAVGVERADDLLFDLAARGLLIPLPGADEDWFGLHALVREYALATWPLTSTEARALQQRAAAWYESTGRYREALEALTAAEDGPGIVRLVDERWRELIDRGSADAVVAAGRVLPAALRSHPATRIIVQAHALVGQFDEALEWLRDARLREGTPEARLARTLDFGIALVYINRDEPRLALEALSRSPVTDTGERWALERNAMTPAFSAYQLLALGDLEEARAQADRAFTKASELPEVLTSLAEAHMALGDVAYESGELTAAASHYDSALEIAERLGNVLATCSARNRRSRARRAEGRLEEALEEASASVELADRIGLSLFQGWARYERAFAFLALGRLDEAEADFTTAREAQDRLGSRAVSIPLRGLGDVHRIRGELAQARSAYERALATAERSERVVDRSLALAGVARTLVDDDPDEALRLADAAVEVAFGTSRIPVRLARGWIAACLGDREAALRDGDAALSEARRQGAPRLIAESLELGAVSDRDSALARLEEAHAIWARMGARLDAERTALAVARIAGRQAEAEQAEDGLRRLGVRQPGADLGLLRVIGAPHARRLYVTTLGQFAVLRDGRPVAASEWQSRKARDLLKILVAHRGRALPRDALMEMLWPDEDPRKTANRLSVALNVVRGVLDPQRTLSQDHFVATGDQSVRLVLEHVPVDLEEFLVAAADALRAVRAEDDTGAALLERAEAMYGGDFLEEDRYDDWAAACRDEARTAYLDVVRALADLEENAGSGSVRYHLRALSLDPYDEDVHLSLVELLERGGRHGEARRAHRRYVGRMREIGVEPSPFPP